MKGNDFSLGVLNNVVTTVYNQHYDKSEEFIKKEVVKLCKISFDSATELSGSYKIFEANAVAIEDKKALDVGSDQTPNQNFIKKDNRVYVAPVIKEEFKDKGQDLIKDDKIVCAICGHEFKALDLHLRNIEHVDPVEYRKVMGYSEKQILASKNRQAQMAKNVDNMLLQNSKYQKHLEKKRAEEAAQSGDSQDNKPEQDNQQPASAEAAQSAGTQNNNPDQDNQFNQQPASEEPIPSDGVPSSVDN